MRNWIIAAIAIPLLVIVAVLVLSDRSTEPETAEREPQRADIEPMTATAEDDDEPEPESEPVLEMVDVDDEGYAILEDGSRGDFWGIPEEEEALNLESQLDHHFIVDGLPDGFEAHNVDVSNRGLALPPPAPGEEDQPRVGMVESPPMELDFPFNAVYPLWKENIPEGTSVLVEVSVSPDGENWTNWMTSEIDHNFPDPIPATNQDGTPNPHEGYMAGNLLTFGSLEFQYARYSIAFYSETGESPAMSDFRLRYTNLTRGEGRLAEPGDLSAFDGESAVEQP